MNVVDIVLLVALVVFAFSGFRQGFVIGALGFAGFVGGGVLGMVLAPRLVSRWQPGIGQALVAVVIVLAAASFGQVLATLVGSAIRRRLTFRPARLADSGAGALLGVVSVLLVAWFVASALVQTGQGTLTREIRRSEVLLAVDRLMPSSARTLFSSFRSVLDDRGFPAVFSGLGAERIVPVDPPSSATARSAVVRSARRSVVKVVGTAASCGRQVEGSGFVYAPGRVMTNAHVVAGVDVPHVRLGGTGRLYATRVVYYDPARDVAVLAARGLHAPSLQFGGVAKRGDSAVVIGFPHNGPFRADPARIRGETLARGQDIYQRHEVTREVYALRGRVQPGNSGGPLLDTDGRVDGVVFAASIDDPSTGYALSAREVAGAARAGRRSAVAVDTGDCA